MIIKKCDVCYAYADGMTQQQAADIAKINLRHYHMFERGDRKISDASFLVAIAVIEALMVNLYNGLL